MQETAQCVSQHVSVFRILASMLPLSQLASSLGGGSFHRAKIHGFGIEFSSANRRQRMAEVPIKGGVKGKRKGSSGCC